MADVSRIGRTLDIAGLGAFLGGAALYTRAWFGFREVEASAPAFVGSASSAIEVADRFWLMERMGTAMMLLAIVIFVAAWWTNRRLSSAVHDN